MKHLTDQLRKAEHINEELRYQSSEWEGELARLREETQKLMQKNQKLLDENLNLNQTYIKLNQNVRSFEEEVYKLRLVIMLRLKK